MAAAAAYGSVDAASGGSHPGKWVLRYFSAPTRGEQVRLLFALAVQRGTITSDDYIDERLTPFPTGQHKYKRSKMGDASPLMFDQTPSITSPDGTHVSQAAAVMQYAGRELRLAPMANEGEAARALALTLYSEELRGSVFYSVMVPSVIEAAAARWCGGICCLLGCVVNRCCCGHTRRAALRQLRAGLPHLEAALRLNAANSSGNAAALFMAGDDASYADVALFDCLAANFAFLRLDADAELREHELLAMWFSQFSATFAEYVEERGAVLDTIVDGLIGAE